MLLQSKKLPIEMPPARSIPGSLLKALVQNQHGPDQEYENKAKCLLGVIGRLAGVLVAGRHPQRWRALASQVCHPGPGCLGHYP
jgi:hypothetical protein